ncbi:MAG: hypothetical protein ABJF50_12140 [Paracoccaceae bacterium]
MIVLDGGQKQVGGGVYKRAAHFRDCFDCEVNRATSAASVCAHESIFIKKRFGWFGMQEGDEYLELLLSHVDPQVLC